ncbi:MAG: TM2 domain-containing protein [Salibacteraceae bacterium]
MKKFLLLFSVVLLGASVTMANPYKVDDASIEAAFEQATEVSILNVTDANNTLAPVNVTQTSAASAGGALIRCWFLGSLGWHRAYLNGEGFLFSKYCWTCGGLGILTTIDWWLLIFKLIGDGDVSQYENNDGWFMWK